MQRLKADPLKFLIEKFNKMPDEEPEKVSIALELLPYAYPKLKSIDMTTEQAVNVTVTIGGDGA